MTRALDPGLRASYGADLAYSALPKLVHKSPGDPMRVHPVLRAAALLVVGVLGVLGVAGWSLTPDIAHPGEVLPEYRQYLVVDVQSAAHRWVLTELRTESTISKPDPTVLHIEIRDGTSVCDCIGKLAVTEVLGSNSPIVDDSGARRSIGKNDYYTLNEIWDYPVDNEEFAAFYVARVASTTHEGLLRSLLARRGFEPLQLHGFADQDGHVVQDGVHFLLVRHEATGRVHLGIRGTGSTIDQQRDMDVRLVPFPGAPGRVHHGFWALTKRIEQAIEPVPDDLIISGHSLGAALGTLFFLSNRDRLSAARVVAFAPPALGDPAFQAFAARYGSQMQALIVPGDELVVAVDHVLGDAGAWPGRRIDLPQTRRSRGRYHSAVNYCEGMLRRHGRGVDDWFDKLPMCVGDSLNCMTPDPLVHVPRCTATSQACLAFAQPDLEAAAKAEPRALQLRYLEGPSVLRPLLLRVLAAQSRRDGDPHQARLYQHAMNANPRPVNGP